MFAFVLIFLFLILVHKFLLSAYISKTQILFLGHLFLLFEFLFHCYVTYGFKQFRLSTYWVDWLFILLIVTFHLPHVLRSFSAQSGFLIIFHDSSPFLSCILPHFRILFWVPYYFPVCFFLFAGPIYQESVTSHSYLLVAAPL